MIARLLAALAAALVLVAPAFAALDAAQQAELKRITDYWNTIQTVEGQFSQVDSNGGASSGGFLIKKPGRFRFDYNPPDELTVIADGYTVAVEDRKLETQDRYPLVETPLSILVDENITLQRPDLEVMDVEKKDGAVRVRLKSLKEDAQGELLIAFTEADLTLQYWVVRDPQGMTVTVRVSGVKLQGDIPASKFFIREPEEDDGR
ncbi:MAG: outer-membrane lipoprotein carrier protein LolA [Alphaproteobacteria bacterium]